MYRPNPNTSRVAYPLKMCKWIVIISVLKDGE